jgi:hypothetical protein
VDRPERLGQLVERRARPHVDRQVNFSSGA